MNLPSLKQLEYFCAVVELSHFGKAAERCFVTQSTLSAGIQELENQLGVQLFERSKRKVLTTPLGLQLYDKAMKLLADAAGFVELAGQGGKPLSGVLRLGCIPTISPFFLPKVLPCIRRQFPDLQLHLVEGQTRECLDRLRRGELDVALIAFPYEVGNLKWQRVGAESFFAAIPGKHPLSKRRSIHSDALPQDELLLLEEGHCLREHVLSACQLNSQGAVGFQGTSLYTLLEMVAGGEGITLVPEMAMQSELMSNQSIRYLPLKDQGPHREFGLVWRPTLARSQEMSLLADTMSDCS